MKPFVVAANWKMNKGPRETTEFFGQLRDKISTLPANNKAIFFVPAINLTTAQASLAGTGVAYGAQNCHFEKSGAFTGELSTSMLEEVRASFCLVGHSERRAIFHETDEETGKKVQALETSNITPMLCVGESLAEREGNRTNEVIVRQLKAGLKNHDASKKIMIAYEPVWAIGTGKVATPVQANEAHTTLRHALTELIGAQASQETPILYGGSVKPDNAAEIARQKEVDGFLVGGASLELKSFWPLCETRKN